MDGWNCVQLFFHDKIAGNSVQLLPCLVTKWFEWKKLILILIILLSSVARGNKAEISRHEELSKEAPSKRNRACQHKYSAQLKSKGLSFLGTYLV